MIIEDLMKIVAHHDLVYCDNDQSSTNCLVDDAASNMENSFISTDSDDSMSNYTQSPGGHKYYKPKDIDASYKPFVNQLFADLDKGAKFYMDYGRMVGFDTRRHTGKKHGDGTILLKYFICSKAGFNVNMTSSNSDISVPNVQKRRRTMTGRCGCNAKMILKFIAGKGYYVFGFVEVHNHPLATEDGRQFLRASREMSAIDRKFVFDAGKVNIGPTRAHSLMKQMAGSYANVGATSTDYRNFNRDLKAYIGDNDGQMIIEKFKVKHETCQDFFYDYEVDVDGRLTKLFWADPISRRNFDIYGDVISFDATFNMNKYNMIFVPFTGVDKHDKCVTYAAALISKEDIPHFNWVFKTFVRAMGRSPVCIITDQCPAMKQAIPNSFDKTRHRLCMWHIMEKFPSKLGNRLCKETDFMEKLKKYVWSSCIEPVEFEEGWKAVIKEFSLENNKWLSDMYDIRKSWIPAYFRDKPMLGLMRTTSRSESENFFFSQFHKNGDTLCEFYIRFESAMDKQRNETAKLNHESSSLIPILSSELDIEKDAAELYTRAIFYKVQKEIMASVFHMEVQHIGEVVDGFKIYKIKDRKFKDKIFEVKVKVSNNHAECSCKKFLMTGILCRHAFCGLKQFGVDKLPRSLVLNRWLKNAEKRHSLSMISSVSKEVANTEIVNVRLTDIWFSFHTCVSKAGVNIDKLNHVKQTLNKLNTELDDDSETHISSTKNDYIANVIGHQPTEEVTIHAPQECKNKGSGGKRILCEREKAINKGKKRKRQCKICTAFTHDSRTCPKKKKDISTKDD